MPDERRQLLLLKPCCLAITLGHLLASSFAPAAAGILRGLLDGARCPALARPTAVRLFRGVALPAELAGGRRGVVESWTGKTPSRTPVGTGMARPGLRRFAQRAGRAGRMLHRRERPGYIRRPAPSILLARTLVLQLALSGSTVVRSGL